MPLNLTVQASVVDLRGDIPQASDPFFVDTNVWYWLTYTRSKLGNRSPHPYQITHYPRYITKAIATQSRLYKCGLTHSEVSHLVENNERDIYNRQNPECNTKEFRHNFPNVRMNVVQEIQVVWQQIEQFGNTLELLLDDRLIAQADQRLAQVQLDGYDLFIVELMFQNGIVNIKTDDCDFVTVPGLTVYTANTTAVEEARRQGQLIKR